MVAIGSAAISPSRARSFSTPAAAPASGGAPRQRRQPDEPPKLLDRVSARAPLNYGASTRKSIGAAIDSFQIVDGAIAYGLGAGARLWRFALGGKDSTMVAESVTQFHATSGGPLFVLEKDGTLWRAESDGSKQSFIDHEVADFQPVGDLVYIVGTDKKLSRLHADGKTRDPVDENVAAFQAIDATLIFVLGTDGALWRESGDFHTARQGRAAGRRVRICRGRRHRLCLDAHPYFVAPEGNGNA